MKKYEEQQHVTIPGYWEDTQYCPETAERMFLHGHATIPLNGIKDHDVYKLRQPLALVANIP